MQSTQNKPLFALYMPEAENTPAGTFRCTYCRDICGDAERYPGTKTCTACSRRLLNGRND